MRPSVRSAFFDFNVPYEGAVPWLYQDVKGLVSIGVGILADPIELALGLPLRRKVDGRLATRDEIIAEWAKIKKLPPNAKGQTASQLGHRYAEPHTTLRLDDSGLRSTLDRKLLEMDRHLAGRFADWETWPADAQLATLSLSWACGPAFRFPKLEASLRARDFRTAAVESHMNETGNPGLKPRNRANRILYVNAAIALHDFDLDHLFWPRDLSNETATQPYPVENPPSSEPAGPSSPKRVVDAPIVHPRVPLDPPSHDGDDE